ncbi:hypothetical protein JXJ21_14255 [candidate division KSB1 bacterium]|nr:hypothetical protein [candidate division KSB1 bacterium]
MVKYIIVLILVLAPFLVTAQMKIVHLEGTVKVRWGIEETWNDAGEGMVLRPEDSIQTGRGGTARLKLEDASLLELTGNTFIDIVECRKITEKEFFLALMAEKVENLEKQDKLRLKIGDVTVIHGDNRGRKNVETASRESDLWWLELNGAKILEQNDMPMNAILKLRKIIRKYNPDDGGEVQYRIGAAFEKLGHTGHAREAFLGVLKGPAEQQWKNMAEMKIREMGVK